MLVPVFRFFVYLKISHDLVHSGGVQHNPFSVRESFNQDHGGELIGNIFLSSRDRKRKSIDEGVSHFVQSEGSDGVLQSLEQFSFVLNRSGKHGVIAGNNLMTNRYLPIFLHIEGIWSIAISDGNVDVERQRNLVV